MSAYSIRSVSSSHYRATRLRALLSHAALIGLLLLPIPAFAVDGVIEINQASALAGGLGLLDTPGFPITLGDRGSYRLTGELNVPPNTTGIVVQNSHITIDLNGFAIVGGGGTFGSGVYAPPGTTGVRIRNGSISGMAEGGIDVWGHSAVVEDVIANGNGEDGIRVDDYAAVRRSTSIGNGLSGIRAGSGSVVDSCVAAENTSAGILAYGSVVSRSAVQANAYHGITVSSGGLIVDNTANGNGQNGINGSNSTGASGNTARDNGNGGVQVGGFDVIELVPNACQNGLCP